MDNILKKLRKEKKLKQNDLAEYLGITQASYWSLESSDINKITTANLQKLADYYNVSIDYLLGRDIEVPQDRFAVFKRSGGEANLTPDQYKIVEDLVNSLEKSNK